MKTYCSCPGPDQEEAHVEVGADVLCLNQQTDAALYQVQQELDAALRVEEGWRVARQLQKVQSELKRRGLAVRP